MYAPQNTNAKALEASYRNMIESGSFLNLDRN